MGNQQLRAWSELSTTPEEAEAAYDRMAVGDARLNIVGKTLLSAVAIGAAARFFNKYAQGSNPERNVAVGGLLVLCGANQIDKTLSGFERLDNAKWVQKHHAEQAAQVATL